MATFERVDFDDLNRGKSFFFVYDSFGGKVQLSQEEAAQLMHWLQSFLTPPLILDEQHNDDKESEYTSDPAELPPIEVQKRYLTDEECARARWKHHSTQWYEDIPAEIVERGEDIWTVEVDQVPYVLCSYWSGSELHWYYQQAA